MHGSVFIQLRHYLEETYGPTVWDDVYKEAKIDPHHLYFMLRSYPDQEMVELVEVAARVTGLERRAFLDDFGRFFAKYLMASYSIMIKPRWRTLDIIDEAHNCFKQLTSFLDSGFSPEELRINRTGPYEIRVHYTNKSQLCSLVIGILHGFADYYHEAITIEHSTCMHNGGSECEIVVSKIPAKQLLMKLKEQTQQKKEQLEGQEQDTNPSCSNPERNS